VGTDAKEVSTAGKNQLLTFMFQQIDANSGCFPNDLALYMASGCFSAACTVYVRSDITVHNT
jgi:hypothetical protein